MKCASAGRQTVPANWRLLDALTEAGDQGPAATDRLLHGGKRQRRLITFPVAPDLGDPRSTAIFVEAERRLTSKITLEIEGRFFVDVDPAGELAAVARDDFVAVRASWNL